jgi:UDP-glucose 6-dehydrogenase
MKYGVVGYGVVGKHMARDIVTAGQEVVIYDNKQAAFLHPDCQAEVNACDCAFVCVPTPAGDNGVLDMSAIYDVFEWLKVPIAVIRSALAIGTTDRLRDLGHNVVVCPEWPSRRS